MGGDGAGRLFAVLNLLLDRDVGQGSKNDCPAKPLSGCELLADEQSGGHAEDRDKCDE